MITSSCYNQHYNPAVWAGWTEAQRVPPSLPAGVPMWTRRISAFLPTQQEPRWRLRQLCLQAQLGASLCPMTVRLVPHYRSYLLAALMKDPPPPPHQGVGWGPLAGKTLHGPAAVRA